MTWLIWRQHRLQGLTVLVVLTALAVPVWITGRHLAQTLATCQGSGSCGAGNIFAGYNVITDIVLVTVIVPLLVGAFWGATVLGKELEGGTAALVWTQTVTRRAWLRAKLVTVFTGVLLGSAALSALVTWWSKTHNAVAESRFNGLQFDIQGLAPVGYSLFSLALGLAAGVVWRRVLPAMATTVVGFIGVRMTVELALRPHYLKPITRLTGLVTPERRHSGDWYFASDALLHGHVLSGSAQIPSGCTRAGSRPAMSTCLERLGYQLRETYQPGGRYWTFQWIEFAIFTGLAVLLVTGALLLLRRRDV